MSRRPLSEGGRRSNTAGYANVSSVGQTAPSPGSRRVYPPCDSACERGFSPLHDVVHVVCLDVLKPGVAAGRPVDLDHIGTDGGTQAEVLHQARIREVSGAGRHPTRLDSGSGPHADTRTHRIAVG